MPSHLRLLALLSALCAVPLAAGAAPVYSVAPVGNSGGVDSSGPQGLNNAGQVVGYAYKSGNKNAYISQNGNATSLHPADPQIASSVARGINDGGVAVGDVAYWDGPTRAAVFSGGSVQILGTLGGQYSSALAVNAGNRVAGVADTARGYGHAFVTGTDGAMLDIGTLGTGTSSAAEAINDGNAVTGYSDVDTDGNFHPFLYANGRMQDLGTLGGNYGEGMAINNRGMVTGYSYLAGDESSHAFLYENGLMLDLGGFGRNSMGTGINESGDVVGVGYDAQNAGRAFLYSGGVFQDLNDLIDPNLGWTLTYAAAINDGGQIVARGCKAGDQCADLLLTRASAVQDPADVPEPGSFSSVIAALALVGLLRRRRRIEAQWN